jgi:crotonobetainyl-CoA:carnitine CoA-transferase CaiB-like acyl-CoA transferase
MTVDVPHPTLGSLPQPGVVPRFSCSPGRVTYAGPALGKHTHDILYGTIGLSAEEIATLRQEGVMCHPVASRVKILVLCSLPPFVQPIAKLQ